MTSGKPRNPTPAMLRVLKALASKDAVHLSCMRHEDDSLTSCTIYPRPYGYSRRQDQVKASTFRVLREEGWVYLEHQQQSGGYTLPDGTKVKLFSQRWVITEAGRQRLQEAL